VGDPAGEIVLDDLSPALVVDLPLIPPPGSMDLAHTLVVAINPGQTIPEWGSGANQASLTLGGLPLPTGFEAGLQRENLLPILTWDAPLDPRSVGVRIYRDDGGGEPAAVGSSLTDGFIDPTAEPGVTYRYAVAAFDVWGIESPLSEWAEVTTQIDGGTLFLPVIIN
jgi:hypothetical protein